MHYFHEKHKNNSDLVLSGFVGSGKNDSSVGFVAISDPTLCTIEQPIVTLWSSCGRSSSCITSIALVMEASE